MGREQPDSQNSREQQGGQAVSWGRRYYSKTCTRAYSPSLLWKICTNKYTEKASTESQNRCKTLGGDPCHR